MTDAPFDPQAHRRSTRPWRVLGIGLVVITAVALALIAALETGWGIKTVANAALRIANPWPGSTLTVASARGGFLSGIELHGIRLRDLNGPLSARIDTLRVRYRLHELMGRPQRARELTIAGLEVVATRPPHGVFDINEPFLEPKPVDLALDRFALRRCTFELHFPPIGRDSLLRAQDLQATITNLRVRDTAALSVDTLAVTLVAPAEPRATLSLAMAAELTPTRFVLDTLSVTGARTRIMGGGTLPVPGSTHADLSSTDFRLSFHPFAGSDIERFLPFLGDPGDLSLELAARGDSGSLHTVLDAHARRGGSVRVEATVPSKGGVLALRTEGRVHGLDLGALQGGPPDSLVIEAAWSANLAGPDRSRISGPYALDLDGTRIGEVDLDQARLEGRLAEGRATFEVRGVAEGFALRSAGWATPFDSVVAYDASVALSVPRIVWPSAKPDSTGTRHREPPILFAGDVRMRLHGRGVTATTADAATTVELDPDSSLTTLLGPGRLDARLAGGVAHWQADLDVASGTVHAGGEVGGFPDISYRMLRIEVAGIDVAAFTGDTTTSRLDAVLHAEGRGVDLGTLRATAEIDSLALIYGIHRIADGALMLRVDRGRAGFEGAATVDRAAFEAQGSVETLPRARSARVTLDVHDLDLAEVTGDTTFASRIAGRVSAEIHGTDLAAWLTSPRSPASFEAARGAVHVELEPSELRDQHISVLDLRGDLERGAVRLGGRFESSFGTARLSSVARPFDETPSLQLDPLAFSSLSPLLLAGRHEPRLELEGELNADLSGQELASLAGTVDLVLDGSRLNAVTFDQLATHSRLADGEIETRVLARAADDSVNAVLLGSPFENPRRLRADGRIHSVDLAALLGIDSVRAGADLAFSFTGEQPRGGSVHDLTLSGSLDGGAWFGEARLDTIAGQLALSGGVAHVERLALRGNVLQADASGSIVLPGSPSRDSTDFRFTGTLDRLETLPPIPGIDELAGRATIRMAAQGRSDALRFRGDVAVQRPHVNTLWADSARVDFSGMLRDTTLAALDATVRARRLVAWPLRSRDLDGTLTWDGRELVTDVASVLEDKRSDHFIVRIEPVEGGIRGRLDRFDLFRQRLDITLQKPAAFEFGRRVWIDDLVLLESGTPRVHAHGGIDSAGMADLRVQVDSLDLADYLDLAGVPALKGHLTLEGSLTGSREQPVVDASMRNRLVSGKRKPAWLTGELAWAEQSFDLSTAFDQEPGHRIALTAQLPLALTLAPRRGEHFVTLAGGAMSSHFEAQRFDFSWFGPLISPRVARQLRGWLNGDVRIEGETGIPKGSGTLALTDAQIELPKLGVRYQRGDAHLSFAERTITLDRATLTSGGKADARGAITFHGRDHRTIDASLSLKRFIPLNTLQAKVTVSGEATLAGTLPTPQLRGNIEVLNTAAYAEGGGELKVEHVELTRRDRLDIQERFGTGTARTAESPSSLIDSVDVDLTVRVGDNVWVRRRSDPIVALELKGDVRARKPTAGPLDARGTLGIQTGRSYMSFVGRRFDLTHAEIDLPGPVDSAQVLIEAFYSPQSGGGSSSDVDVTAVVRIDADGVKTDLRSEPYLDQSALLNYLATGQVQGGMESGTAYGLAVGTALGAVGGVAGRSLGLDVVQVTMDANGGQTLSAGSYVDPRVYLGFRQPVVQDQTRGTSSTSGSTPTEFEVEVEARKNLLFNLQGSSARYRFLLRPRLGR